MGSIMAHYAFLDKNNIVTEVIVGVDENQKINGKSPEVWYSKFRGQVCKRTSYNANIRKNFAAIGSTYDAELDAFIDQKPFESWILDTHTCRWVAPIEYPTDGLTYFWDEVKLDWTLADFSSIDK